MSFNFEELNGKFYTAFCVSGIFWDKKETLIYFLTKALRTGRQWLLLNSNKIKAQNPFVTNAEPMAIVDPLETRKQETLWM